MEIKRLSDKRAGIRLQVPVYYTYVKGKDKVITEKLGNKKIFIRWRIIQRYGSLFILLI